MVHLLRRLWFGLENFMDAESVKAMAMSYWPLDHLGSLLSIVAVDTTPGRRFLDMSNAEFPPQSDPYKQRPKTYVHTLVGEEVCCNGPRGG